MSAAVRLFRARTQQLTPKRFSTNAAASGESGLKAMLPAVVYNNAGLAIFAGAIGGIVGMIWRTSAASTNFNAVRDELADQVLLDRHEIEDLMHQNRSLNVDTYAEICRSLSTAFPLGRAPYREFVAHVQGYLESPLKLGHLLDRVILTRAAEEEDVRLLMTLLALAMETDTLEDRARSLFFMFSSGGGSNDDGPATNGASTTQRLLSKEEVTDSIEYLHSTQQIPVEKKVIKTDREYPVQTYVEVRGLLLCCWSYCARFNPTLDVKSSGRNHFFSEQQASAADLLGEAALETSLEANGPFTEDQFVDLILGKAVCAWGSCYPSRNGATH